MTLFKNCCGFVLSDFADHMNQIYTCEWLPSGQLLEKSEGNKEKEETYEKMERLQRFKDGKEERGQKGKKRRRESE